MLACYRPISSNILAASEIENGLESDQQIQEHFCRHSSSDFANRQAQNVIGGFGRGQAIDYKSSRLESRYVM